MNTITGVIQPYAGGRAAVGQARAPIDSQGNFTVPVSPQPTTQNIILTPPLGAPYSPLSLSVSLVPGATNITTQITGALTVVGAYVGIPGTPTVSTDSRGYASPGSDSGTITAVTASAPAASSGGSAPNITIATATTSVLGVVKPDGATIGITAGVIGVPTATTSVLGVVKPDGTTILVSAGVLSVNKVPSTIYSVAGTPLPAATGALMGARAVVSDATAPLWMAVYKIGRAHV